MLRELKLKLQNTEYSIFIERGILREIGPIIKQVFKGRKIVVVTDENVNSIYGLKISHDLKAQGYEVCISVIPAGESSKSFDQLTKLYNNFVNSGLSRKDLIISIGGGVTGDLTGFAAATYMRGIPYIQIPTSLLAQIDSSIGGKVAVNLPQGKNLVGSFYHPMMVVIDPDCINTLEKRYLSDGAAEAVKYACIRDEVLLNIILGLSKPEDIISVSEEIIYRCCDIKRDIVEIDEKENGDRMLLNFGHTIGHAVENYYNYSKYTHGEGVAIGMCEIAKVSENHGFAVSGISQKINSILTKLSLPTTIGGVSRNDIISSIYKDKKNDSEYSNLVLIRDFGSVFIHKIKTSEVDSFFGKGGL